MNINVGIKSFSTAFTSDIEPPRLASTSKKPSSSPSKGLQDQPASGTVLKLLPGWEERLQQVSTPAAATPHRSMILPRTPDIYASKTTFVDSAQAAEMLLDFAQQRQLAFVGIDTEFRYTRPPVEIDRSHEANDVRSVRPLLLSLALVEPNPDGDSRLYRFVVDLRKGEVLPALRQVLWLPVCFVGHYLQAELICLLQLGLPEPTQLWDTWVHEVALYLGKNHKNYKLTADADAAQEARVVQEIEEDNAFSYDLLSTCSRYGVTHPFILGKERMQKSFLDHADGLPFSDEQIEYAAADAEAAARLYQPQVLAATHAGVLGHLVTVEMPWVVTNARMVWHGVRFDSNKCRRAVDACQAHLDSLRPRLEALGVPNVRSHQQLEAFFKAEGLLELFRHGDKISFDKGRLAEFQDRHPAIPLIRAARRVHDLLKDKILTGEFVGTDGRVHPEYRHLGTHTGRQTSRWPNVLGLGRLFRPLIIPDPGYGIGEADWCQIEVGIAAAVYHDDALVAMFNAGDVYSSMAQDFYANELPSEHRTLPGKEFKKLHPNYRAIMKTCTLGIIYGFTAYGLALRLNTSKAEAQALLESFLSMFPTLRRALADTPTYGALRGYVPTVSGLRRNRAETFGSLTNWERNWMTNHPVQGSAAVVFKVAGNRLDKLYHRYGARLIIPMHDAFVFEAPLNVLDEVASLTERTMCDAVQESFPQLRPQVEVNTQHPECWNKDGHADAVERWLDDPTYSF
jgi:DNA polymerase-1